MIRLMFRTIAASPADCCRHRNWVCRPERVRETTLIENDTHPAWVAHGVVDPHDRSLLRMLDKGGMSRYRYCPYARLWLIGMNVVGQLSRKDCQANPMFELVSGPRLVGKQCNNQV